ncbi:MAG: hypothetical protein PVF40_10020 [Ectothiorhodospiraceae bacterium]|jgi:hypothetical protein
MAILDFPAPLLTWFDVHAAAAVPATLRLVIWGAIGALVSMGLYVLLSPQGRIAQGKRELAEARQRLDAYDGDFAGGWPLIKAMLGVALRQVGRVSLPAIVASLPLLSLLVWVSTSFAYAYPPRGETPVIHTSPPHLNTRWVPPPAGSSQPPHVLVADSGMQQMIADIPLAAPVPVVHKRQWWNAMWGNPAGYLGADKPLDWVRVELPRQHYLGFGPEWLRGWEFTFFASLVAVSVIVKVVAKIE